MTRGQAQLSLSLLWVLAIFPLLILLVLQSILGKYGNEWDTPWNWFAPLVFPSLSLMISAWVEGSNKARAARAANSTLCWGTILLSIGYITLLYAVVIVHPFSDTPIQSTFRNSSWY